MVRLKFSIELDYQVGAPGSDFIFNFQAAHTPQQTVVHENLAINQALSPRSYTDPLTHTRYLRLHASPGPLVMRYDATVDIDHHQAQPGELAEVPVGEMPDSVLTYLLPSRYCQSDRLQRMATFEFGHMQPGYSRVQAIRDWVTKRVRFQSNSSNGNTAAVDTLIEQVGVCRDFAHLMIALCRAVSIPARFVTGIDFGADPALGPSDFHAYVEVYVGHRWYLFDPSGTAIPMGFVRFATGRDAADGAFATMFGSVTGQAPIIAIEAVPDGRGNFVEPQHVEHALSTYAECEAA